MYLHSSCELENGKVTSEHSPDVLFIAVGLKTDRHSKNDDCITPEEGRKICELIG